MAERVRHLQVLCPQLYDGMRMLVTPCNQCTSGWDRKLQKCTVETGAEDLPNDTVPTCPMQDQCRHQIQSATPCTVRQAGLICESALVWSGLSEAAAADHPLSFHAGTQA